VMEEEGDVIDDVVTFGGASAGVTVGRLVSSSKAGCGNSSSTLNKEEEEIIFLLFLGLGVTSSLEEDMCGDRLEEEEEGLDVLIGGEVVETGGELGTGDRM
jgi:hypothetical protein